jgi:hypothetical protein
MLHRNPAPSRPAFGDGAAAMLSAPVVVGQMQRFNVSANLCS